MHSHLLPGIDDGVKNEEECIECVKGMKELGLEKLIITPHISRDYFPNQEFEIVNLGDVIKEKIKIEGVDIKIEVAAEYLIDEFFINKIESRELLSFGKQNCVLIESGWANQPLNFEEIIFRMMINGYRPILAHPERYTYYQKDIELLNALKQAGCYLQINWMSLFGKYGNKAKEIAQKLLEKGQVDFIGSDVHRVKDVVTIKESTRLDIIKLLDGQKLLNADLYDN